MGGKNCASKGKVVTTSEILKEYTMNISTKWPPTIANFKTQDLT